MTTIDELCFSLVWCRLVPESLAAPFGPLVSRRGFRDAVTNGVPGLSTGVPWPKRGSHRWSRFWSSYVGNDPRKLRSLTADARWDYLVPFALEANAAAGFAGPPPADSVEFDVWLFPHAVVVIATVVAVGSWTPSAAAAAAAELRGSNRYGRGEPGNRNLDGLATELADVAATVLAPNAASAGVSNPLSIAAGIAASGDVIDLDLARPDVASCVSGLAVLGRKGVLNADHLLDVNTDERRGGRVYWEKSGHTIWNAEAMIELPKRCRCVQHNHTHAIAMVTGLSALVHWVADQVSTRQVPVEVHGLLDRAMCRLAQLDAGDVRKTYRAGIVSERIAPVRPAMQIVERAGLPSGR